MFANSNASEADAAAAFDITFEIEKFAGGLLYDI
jgi:hypothetical protein